jgi:hypothetical protein
MLFMIFVLHTVSGAALDQFFNDASSCELHCTEVFSPSSDHSKSCAEGCRLFKIIELAKGFTNNNKTLGLCLSACSEAFINASSAVACNHGCRHYMDTKSKGETQTLHLLTPLFYMRSAYNTVAHHVRQFIATSWTVYVQEGSGKMIVLQTNPKIVESTDYPVVKEKSNYNYIRNYQQTWPEERLDWMDCISHQSGIPRWLLVIVLFGFILALLWLCCATAVTAPNHYLSSSKKKSSYVLLCEPNHDLKPPPTLINCDEEAPPLPPKVSLI